MIASHDQRFQERTEAGSVLIVVDQERKMFGDL
jgi:hypothetical protein